MATTSTHHQWAYDVFVSFRGEDIRKNFIDHLFNDFKQKGIHVFRDDNELPRGEEISSQLYKAIEVSRFFIVIFSKNYASSSWCLRELSKILECKQMGEHKHEVRIIFYDVKPDVVRKQTGSYAEAFSKHECSNRTEAAKWKDALCMATNLSGWDIQDMTNGYESKFIDSISKEILKKLCYAPLHVGENLVGLDAYANKMNLLRFIGSGKVHMIGICGISGIGKTTLAKAIYNSMCVHFEEYSFCEDVKKTTKRQGVTQVQMQLINKIMKIRVETIGSVSDGIMLIKRMTSKPILLVLDDVNDQKQLEALAGSHTWFYPGSFIIFTSKNKQLLRTHKVDEIHDMSFLQHHEALELFSWYAFRKRHPVEDFEVLAYQVVKYLQGHPLALKVLGCCLYDKPMCVWKSEIDRLQYFPNEEIQKKLRPSYHGLSSDQRRIFLDIACSFVGENKDFVASVLESDTSFPYASMEVLVDKSLMEISRDDKSLQMHGLIRSMARGILDDEFEKTKVKSRLWNSSGVCNVLSKNKATKAEVEAVEVLDLLLEESSEKAHIDGEAFEDMKNLRILKICYREPKNFWKPFELKDYKVNYSGRLKSLSNKLRLLYWHGFPFKLPLEFYPENIVAIDLSYSYINNLWTTPKCFRRLKVMKLKHCRNLTTTPDFTNITNLEKLNLEGCVNLVNVHQSFGMLKRLVVLNMRDCKRFRSFPCKVELDSLEVMNLSGCSKVDKLPDFFDTIQTLKEFCVDGTAIMELPSFVFSQCNLQVLRLGRHERIRSRRWTSISQLYLPSKMQHPQSLMISSLAGLCFLRELTCSDCNILEVPDSIGGLSCLEYLDLHGNNFTNFPRCLSQLSRLKTLQLSDCKKLEVLPELPPSISLVTAINCTSLEELQGVFSQGASMVGLFFKGCPKLFRNLTIESQVSMSERLRPLNSSITSHGSKNQLSSLLRYMNIPSTIRRIFLAQERRLWFDIVFRGNRMPGWFTNQSMGNHVKVDLPPDWCYNKFRGYVTCVVFTPKKSCRVDIKHFVNNFDGGSLVDSWPFSYDQIQDGSIGVDELDIIWFHFSMESWRWRQAKEFVTFSFKEDYGEVEVKEVGVKLVFDEDIQEETYLCFTQDLPTPAQGEGLIGLSVNCNTMVLLW